MKTDEKISDHLKIATISTTSILVLVFYDIFWDLFLSLLHSIWMLLHFLFETFEQLLDLAVEHIFHTSPRVTEIIVFYLMAAMLAVVIYMIIRALPILYFKLSAKLKSQYVNKKLATLDWWQRLPIVLKLKWCSFFMASSMLMMMLTFS